MANWSEKTIEGWSQLQSELDSLASACVFRGQGNREWRLIPSVNRVLHGVGEADALLLERRMILEFRSEAHLHLKSSVMPPDMFRLDRLDTYLEWLMLMQHYGAPTRLLDWTHSPYVAIYLAVVEEWNADAAIWFFDSVPADKLIYQHYEKSHDELLDYAEITSNVIRCVDAVPMIYTARKKMRTAREVAQQGIFTFTNRILADHQDAIALTCQECQRGRIIIPKELKPEFLWRLKVMNVGAATLFPGVEGICDSLRNEMRLAAESARMTIQDA